MLKAHNHWPIFKYVNLHYQQKKEATPNINLTRFEPLKPSRSGDISLLVFKISKEAMKQPCLDQKIQCLFSKYSYFLCIF